MVKLTQFESAISEITETPTGDFKHPFLTKIKFIFADNKGNANAQGLEEEDFPSIAETSINMPIKMLYKNGGVGNHDFSIPIGHITAMRPQTNSADESTIELMGEAVLYTEEYPDEVDFLKESYDHGHAPGLSWEMAYKDSVKRDGVDWLKGAVTRAATFVKFPAYGKRTALLAIAQSHQDEDGFAAELQALLDSWADKPNIDKGGKNVDEKEIQKLQDDLAAAQARVTELEGEVATATTSITTLTTEKDALAEEVSTFKRSATIADRTAKVVEAGLEIPADQLEAKQTLWLSFSDDQFAAYVADLAEAKKAATPKKDASASTKKDDLPRFIAVAGTDTSIDDLKSLGRRASRGQLADL